MLPTYDNSFAYDFALIEDDFLQWAMAHDNLLSCRP